MRENRTSIDSLFLLISTQGMLFPFNIYNHLISLSPRLLFLTYLCRSHCFQSNNYRDVKGKLRDIGLETKISR